MQDSPSALTARALELHRDMLAVDTHCDTPLSLLMKGYDISARHGCETLLGGDLDLARMREGGLAAAFFAVFVEQGPRTPEGFAQARSMADHLLDLLDRMFEAFPAQCERALAPGDAARIHAAGKRAIFLGMENGYPIGQDLALLDGFHRRGVRYLTLCHAADNDICASSTSGYAAGASSMASRLQADTGLTPFGASVVARMNDLGMLVDVSHVSDRTVDAVIGCSRAPVLASHSGARAVSEHPRNLADPQVRAIADRGGVVQVCFVPEFLRPGPANPGDSARRQLMDRRLAHYTDHAIGEDPQVDDGFERQHQDIQQRLPPTRATVSDVADHIDHLVRVSGIDHVGIGSDFDGGGRLGDCRDVSELPALTAELLRRGYGPADIRLIWGGNAMRVLGEAQARSRPSPSPAA